MTVYTVHEPPPRRYENAGDPERFVFVRDGFAFWAFLFGPLWMLRHRMWLVLFGYVIVVVAAEVALHLLGASAAVSFAVGFLFALLIGFEAATLRRFALGRRKWSNVGVIVADDLEAAERRFFDAWVKDGGMTLTPPRRAAPSLRQPPATPDVIGLFPQPGTRR